MENGGHEIGSNYYYSEEQIWGTNKEGDLFLNSANSLKNMFLDVLLPTGILIPIQCPISRTLTQLKQDIFIQAKKLPLSSNLLDISNYIFSTIGIDGAHVELYDEQKTVSSLYLCLPILVLIEPEGNTTEKELAQNIGTVMGVTLHEIEKNLTQEANLFRLKLFETCQEAERERGINDCMHYAFPREPITPINYAVEPPHTHDMDEIHEEDLDYIKNDEMSTDKNELSFEVLDRKLKFYEGHIKVWYKEDGNKSEFKHFIHIDKFLRITSNDIISIFVGKLEKNGVEIEKSISEFILQIAGRRVYITNEDIYISQYEYIRSCVCNYQHPQLIMCRKNEILQEYLKPIEIFEPTYVRKEKHNQYLKSVKSEQEQLNPRVFWDLDENLRIKIHSASQISVLNLEKIFIRVVVAVGRHVLNVKDSIAVSPNNPRWNASEIEFDIYLKDLPESTQLSFSLISMRKRKNRVEITPIGWMNLRIFDWRSRLIQGKQALYLWPFPKDFNDTTNLTGIHGSNYNETAPKIEVEFPEYETFVEYPNETTIDKFIAILKQREARKEPFNQRSINKFVPGNPDLEKILFLRRCLDASKLTEDDQNFIWKVRYKIQKLFPQMLVVLADCSIIWRERETICEFYHLLKKWPRLQVDTAIELLDSRYVDRKVRTLAVENLDQNLDDYQLQLYLLILIQAIRYESYADSPLVKMLLKRSLMNYRVGHTVFWLIRAELAHFILDTTSSNSRVPHLYVRFALLLEAYCRGNAQQLSTMIKQVEMISTLTVLSVMVHKIGHKETANKKLQLELQARKDLLQFLQSPLNPNDFLGELLVSECYVLGSAKMPFKLTWRNPENLAEITSPTHQLIFKNGDDMRQDMLTVQVMRIMDSKWKSQNKDYCMTLYEVLPMGRNIGLIHVVQNCQTLFQIQCEAKQVGSSFNMDVSLLNKYLYQKCSLDSKQYMECVDRFTSSLIGYCVATYVLGIKDRHQDNIMLARDGRLFHIDFGHFLGHTKRKLGINRERTEFILTDHFLSVIARGRSNVRRSYEFQSFRKSCTDAFMVLYHHARFFIVLFRMMLCMGLPELASMDDVDFLINSLMYQRIERDEVRAEFQKICEDVVKGELFVSINWFFHSVKHM